MIPIPRRNRVARYIKLEVRNRMQPLTRAFVLRPVLRGFLVAVSLIACTKSEHARDPSTARSEPGDSLHRTASWNGPVPDERTAIRVGEDVLVSKYGRLTIDAEKPLVAHLK